MSTHKLALGLGCLLVAACGAPPPPAASAPDAGLDMRLDPPPVHALFGHRADLSLTSEQIDALDRVGQEVHAETHSRMVQIQNLDQNGSNLQSRQKLLHLASQIHLINHRAMEQVRGILTERQRTQACRLFADSRGTARGLQAVTAPDIASRSQSRATGAVAINARRHGAPVWAWCQEMMAGDLAR
jgi:hypothetical protein